MIGHIRGFPSSVPLIAATDASLHKNCHSAGYAWLAADGRWGMESASRPHWMAPLTINGAELRAVALMLRTLVPDLLLTDSAAVTGYLAAWKRGVRDVPPSYAHSGTLARAMTVVARNDTRMRVEHVPAHRGHLLNEAADSLASIARSRDSGPAKRERADSLVRSFLISWHQEAGAA